MSLSLQEYERICNLHEEESWWYLFLNYGCPSNNAEFKIKFEAISEALKQYIKYMEDQKLNLKSDRELYL